jgi:hypothetical protein
MFWLTKFDRKPLPRFAKATSRRRQTSMAKFEGA